MPPVDAHHLHAILARWDTPPLVATERLEGNNPVWKLKTEGRSYILKDISDAPNLERLSFTMRVLTHVTARGVRVPIALPSRAGEQTVVVDGRSYLLFAYIDAGVYPREPDRVVELFRNTGAAIADLHAALVSFPDPDAREQTWREDPATSVMGWTSDLIAGLPETDAATVERIRQRWGDTTVRTLTGLPEQLIHRDCHSGNILVDGTRVIGFVDCDHLCIGPRIFDLAYYASNTLKWLTEDAEAMRRRLVEIPALVEGYAARQPLTDAERAALPHMMIAYHLLLAGHFMTKGQYELIVFELRSLDWLDRNLDALTAVFTQP